MRKDSQQHKGLRKQLVKTLIRKGINDENVLEAIATIPRHFFLEEAFAEWAYRDQAFQIGEGQTISQPYTVARQTELLELEPGMKVLEIGTGSGYQACVLSFLDVKVYSIERQENLYVKTAQFLHKIGFGKIRTLFGDGYAGSSRFAPFDRIIVTAGATKFPTTLFEQLKIGGIMVIPIGDDQTQKMIRITKTSESSYEQKAFGNYSFVPFLKGTKAEY
jgi:protein-L-isoaspartate(D-aspartate) O-methyltransferase